MDQDSYWGTFPWASFPFFAFSLPTTSRKADLGPALLLALSFSPGRASDARPDTVTRRQSVPSAAEVEREYCFVLLCPRLSLLIPTAFLHGNP